MSNQTSDNNKRIAKNTLFLYFRMLFMMAVSLYTSRVVLDALGIEDFGIYNVVGGFVAMFTFINTSMSSATERFLNYEMGCGNKKSVHTVFCTSVNIHSIISIVILILAETVGLWFLNTKMVIPESRMTAALWVYQLSIFSTVISPSATNSSWKSVLYVIFAYIVVGDFLIVISTSFSVDNVHLPFPTLNSD